MHRRHSNRPNTRFTHSSEYIDKIDFDKVKKKEFLEALKESLFEEHEEFLSNPLLAAMMLLTYDEYGEIPARRHVFFEKCFQVLLREHDVSKSRYRRQFHSGMDYAELETVLRHFCVLSYLDRKFSFKHEDILNTIRDALADLDFEADPNSLLQDLTKSISMLQKDGDYYEFVHRSFQEYFYAKFVVSDREFTLEEKLKEFLKVDDVIDMVIDMDRGYFETSFLLPRVRKLNRQFAKIDPEQKPDLIMNKFFANSYCGKSRHENADDLPPLYVGYSVSHEEREYEPRGLNLQVYWYLLKNYSDLRPHQNKGDTPSKEILLEIFNTTEQKAGSPRTNIPLRAHNRNKLIQLGAGKFAKQMKESLAELEIRLERTTSKRSSSLSGKLRANR